MHDDPILSVVIPAYNESIRLSESLPYVSEFLHRRDVRHEIIVVDDGSDDETAEVVRDLMVQCPGTSLIRLPENRGKGAAVRAGISRASGTWVLIADADLSAPIWEFDRLWAAVEEGADAAIGSRALPGSVLEPPASWRRRVSGRLFNAIVRVLGLVGERDTQCGFKLVRREALLEVLEECRIDGFAFDVEILALLRRANREIREVPIAWGDDPDTRVSFGRDGTRMLTDALALWARLLTPKQRLDVTLFLAVVGILLLRLLGLGLLPLTDPSESRYFAIATTMLESGDWLVPRFPDGTPFWGKPPLHFWLMALSMASFGTTEFAARLPSAMALVVLMLATYTVSSRLYDRTTALLAVAVLSTSVFAFGYSALTLTDMTLAAAIGVALGAFYVACVADSIPRSRTAELLLFAALGVGMLIKGPVAIAIFAATVAVWSAFERSLAWRKRLHWWQGAALFTAVAAPWFVAAEMRTPGLLEYFFVNENLLRFLSTDYGDLYGGPHEASPGHIWVFALLGFLPWSLALFGSGVRRALREVGSSRGGRFLMAWALAAPVFFTASRNVVLSYALPSLPALAILAAAAFGTRDAESHGEAARRWKGPLRRGILASLALVLTLALLIAAGSRGRTEEFGVSLENVAAVAGLFAVVGAWWMWSERRSVLIIVTSLALVLAGVEFVGRASLSSPVEAMASTAHLGAELRAHPEVSGCEVVFFSRVPRSAEFYLGVRPRTLERRAGDLQDHLVDGACHVFVMRGKHRSRVPRRDMERLSTICEHGRYKAYWAPAMNQDADRERRDVQGLGLIG